MMAANPVSRSNVNPALERAEVELLAAMLTIYALVGFRDLNLSVERQAKIIAQSDRERLAAEGWVI